jgi:transcriptional regulator with XRE-family HTH domain
MAKKQASQTSRDAKFYDDALNSRLRDLIDSSNTRTEDFANAVGATSSAVRMWYSGYSRPDIEKIPMICSFFDVSSDYLLGISEIPSSDIETRDICEKTGLDDNALLNLMRVAKAVTEQDGYISIPTAKEMVWLVNNLLQDIDLLMNISNYANGYVQMRALDVKSFGDGVDNGAVMQLLELGYKNFGPTFNFTVGNETADNHLFVCQRYLTEVLDSINTPAWQHKFSDSYSKEDDE